MAQTFRALERGCGKTAVQTFTVCLPDSVEPSLLDAKYEPSATFLPGTCRSAFPWQCSLGVSCCFALLLDSAKTGDATFLIIFSNISREHRFTWWREVELNSDIFISLVSSFQHFSSTSQQNYQTVLLYKRTIDDVNLKLPVAQVDSEVEQTTQ